MIFSYNDLMNAVVSKRGGKTYGAKKRAIMSYETLVPFLIKAIQEQQAQIEELKNKLN